MRRKDTGSSKSATRQLDDVRRSLTEDLVELVCGDRCRQFQEFETAILRRRLYTICDLQTMREQLAYDFAVIVLKLDS